MTLKLTDSQLQQVMDLARVIGPAQRGAFLEMLADRARGVELGPGSLHRLAADTLREFLTASSQRPSWIDGTGDSA